MIHLGMLPYHPQWATFLANLRYVVIDELHVYRGVFGSHVANVLRRLRRLCAFYGASPQFLCASATIANPKELAERLVESPVTLVDEDGAPKGERHLVFYNPPLVDPALGLRRSSLLEAEAIAARLVDNGVQTVVFARSRLSVEVLLTYLRDRMASAHGEQVDDSAVNSASPKLIRSEKISRTDHSHSSLITRTQSAAIAAGICPKSGARSSAAYAKAASRLWSLPTRWSLGSTSAGSMQPC